MKLTAFFLLFSITYIAFTQPYAALRGQVIDIDIDETIPFATVVLKDNDGTVISGTVSDFDGKFNLQAISPGIYTIEATFVGYRKTVLENIELKPNQITYLDIEMMDLYNYDPIPEYYHDNITRSALSFSSLLMFVLGVLVL